MAYFRRSVTYAVARRAADIVVSQVLGVQAGDEVVISNDPEGFAELEQVLIDAVRDVGATPIGIHMPSQHHPGEALPAVVTAAAGAANVWIELNRSYIVGTKAHADATQAGLRRLYSLTGMDASDLVALFCDVDLAAVERLGHRLAELSTGRSELRITCPNGSDFTASLVGTTAEQDTVDMPLGQTHMMPIIDSAAGRLVMDAYAFPPGTAGRLERPVAVTFGSGGEATVVRDSSVAEDVADFIDEVGEAGLAELCHVSYGFHPAVLRPFGSLVRDERIFGSLCIGLGEQIPYTSHIDFGICFATVEIDGVTIQKDGRYVDEELQSLSRQLGVPGY